MQEPLDFLTFGPHPDDAEIGTGAFLVKMKRRGYRTVMIILTEGDMGSGTSEIRRDETKRAAHDLELDVHEVLDLGDTRLEDSYAWSHSPFLRGHCPPSRTRSTRSCRSDCSVTS